jgi:diacylglycerol kinase family enzyme
MVTPKSNAVASSAQQVLILVNPKAGRGEQHALTTELTSALRHRELEVQLVESLDQLGQIAGPLHEAQALRTVVAVGGDGTVAAVANATDGVVPITVVPMGTENLLARHFALQTDIEQVCRAIEQNQTCRLDAGRVNGRMFLIMFSCGFDADVVRRLDSQRTGNISRSSYMKPILAALRTYQHPRFRVVASNALAQPQEAIQMEGHWLFAFNLPRYARGLPIAPEASPLDGQLDVCLFRGGSSFAGFFHFVTVLAGSHGAWSNCYRGRFTKLRIEANSQVPYQIDGDAGGVLPVDIDILRQRVPIVLPAV